MKLMEWFGGKADGEYKFQKLLFKDVGAGFGVKSLFDDPEMREAYKAYGDVEMIKKQQSAGHARRTWSRPGSANGRTSTARPGSRRCSASSRPKRR